MSNVCVFLKKKNMCVCNADIPHIFRTVINKETLPCKNVLAQDCASLSSGILERTPLVMLGGRVQAKRSHWVLNC